MLRIPCLSLALALLLPTGAHAGPWPRPAGTGFVEFRVEASSVAQLYAERGIGHDLTLIGKARSDGEPSALIEVQKSWLAGSSARALRFGLASGGEARAAVLWGQGLMFASRPGWLSAEVEYADGAAPALKLSGEVGLRAPGRWIAFLGAWADLSEAWRAVTVQPSVGLEVGAGRSVILSASAAAGDSRERKVALSLWFEF